MGLNPHADIPEPETIVERIAYALAAQDITGGEGYLSDDELEGAEIIWRHMFKLCPNWHDSRSAAAFLRIPLATYERYVYKFIWLMKLERARRDTKGKATMHADMIKAFWPDYMKAAQSVYSVMLERPELLKKSKKRKPTESPQDGE